MTHRSRLYTNGDSKRPKHYDLLIQIWQAAAAEPIGLLINVPESDKTYWYNQLYRVRTHANDQALFQLELGFSRYPNESNLQIIQKSHGSKSGPNHSADLNLGGILNLDLPED